MDLMVDALWWNPITDPTSEDTLAEFDIHNKPEVSTAEIWAITNTNLANMHLKDLKYHADRDQEYQQLKQLIPQGFPDHRSQLSEIM